MQPGSQLAHYQIVEKIGEGGMGVVYKARDLKLERFVALKVLPPGMLADPERVRRFEQEAKTASALNHPNIVTIHDIAEQDGVRFIVMEFIEGVNLKALISYLRERKQPFPMPVACYIAVKVCEGLHYAHEATDNDGNRLGIVHRDVSPPNVLLSRRGEIKIVDFGLAKAAHSVEKTEPGVVKGKFSYLSPEAAEGLEVDLRADIFAVGIILWEMLSGQRLFLGDSDYSTVMMVRKAEIPLLSSVNKAVPPELDRIIARALARDRDQRYGTARELGRDLTRFLYRFGRPVNEDDVSALVRSAMGTPAQHAWEAALQSSFPSL